MKRAQNQELTKQEQLSEAVRTAVAILAYADNTKSQLFAKLVKRGYDEDVAQAAVDRMVDGGFLREEKLLLHTVEYLASAKLFGRQRILHELRRRGFSRELIDSFAATAMAEIDFDLNCAALLNKYPPPSDHASRDKIARALSRYGYSAAEIRHAFDNAGTGTQGRG